MGKNDYYSLTEILNRERILIKNSLNDDVIATRMAGYGYPAEKIGEGETLLTDAENLYSQQKQEYAEYYAAADNFSAARENFHEVYIKDLEFARIAFTGQPSVLRSIEATGSRAPSYADYVEQAKAFYKSFINNETLLNGMTVFGYTLEYFQEKLDTLNNFATLLQAREREEGDAQQATKDRDKKFDELSDWCSLYRRVAMLAFTNDAQYLEKLGIVVKS